MAKAMARRRRRCIATRFACQCLFPSASCSLVFLARALVVLHVHVHVCVDHWFGN